MKKLIIIVAALILTLTACAKQTPDPAEASEPVEPVYRSEQTGRITVGIQIGEEGYYSTYADAEISYLDDEIVDRFVERMRIVREIGRRKRERALPVMQNDREEAILHRLAARAGAEFGDAVRELYAAVFAISRDRQQ